MIHFLSLNIWYVIYVVFWIKYWNLKLPHHCILFLFTICTVSQLFWNRVVTTQSTWPFMIHESLTPDSSFHTHVKLSFRGITLIFKEMFVWKPWDTTGCLLGNQARPHKKLYCVCDVWDLQRWPQSCLAIDSGYANWLWMSAVFCCYSKVHKSISESRVKEKLNALIWAQSTHTEVLPIKLLNIEGNGVKAGRNYIIVAQYLN